VITRIEAHRYRCFPRLVIDLGRYHVLAGANGAGKTTLLDIPVLLGDLLGQKSLADAFLSRRESRAAPRAHTLSELVYQEIGDTISFAMEARLPDDVTTELAGGSLATLNRPALSHLRYELILEVSSYQLKVAEEYLFLYAEQGNRPVPGNIPQGKGRGADRQLPHADWQSVISRERRGLTRFAPETTASGSDIPLIRVPQGQLALGAVLPDATLFPASLWFYQLARDGVVYFDPDWDLLRQAARPGDPGRLMTSGRNTPWLALDIQRTDPDRFASWVDHVRTALPQVEDIRAVEREEDHRAYFSVEYAGGYQVTSSGLSDGTLRILALTLLPYLDPAVVPRLLVVEEPENGIHPRAIETVVQSLTSLYESQVWVSTHSPIVLAHTELTDVLAARFNDDGAVTVVSGDQHPRLKDWHGSLDIGTLFAAGVLS
jgi:AAA domain, putative AbiEii toxin, Type IV TA system